MKSSKDTLSPPVSVWDSPYLQIIIRIIIWPSWIWLILFSLFVLTTALQVGHLPIYGQPDPKDVGLSVLFYIPTILLLIWVMVTTPVGLGLAIIRLWKSVPQSIRRQEVLFYLGGIGLFYLSVLSDVAGLMTWLAD